MKLMFASDIHGSLPTTERVLERFAQSGARWLIILGDVLNHGPRNALPEGYAPGEPNASICCFTGFQVFR